MFFFVSVDNIKKWEQKGNLKPIIKALESKDAGIKNEAVQALIRLGKPVVKPLLDASNKFYTYNHDLPGILVKVYRQKKDDEVCNLLIEALDSKNDKKGWQRMAATEALGQIKDKRAEGPIIGILNDGFGAVNSYAVTALGNMKSEKAVIPLCEILVDDHGYIQNKVIDALVKIGKPAVSPLLEKMNSPQAKCSEAAVKALNKIKGRNGLDDQQLDKLNSFLNLNKVNVQRGGLGEPYCSRKCLDEAAVFIVAVLSQKPDAVCGICSKKLPKSGYTDNSFGFIPYQGKVLFICSDCAEAGEKQLKKHKKCCMCRRNLSSM